MATCPSCGRHLGPADTNSCPHCGARLAGRMAIRVLRIGALGLAVLGLGLLWWFATHTPIPTLKISQAQATMNFAYVRMEGQVTRAPSYDPDGGYLSFWIADDTGEMLVGSYRATTQALVDSGRAPGVGDRVAVEGTLRVREDSTSLTLNSPDAVRVEHPQPVVMDIGQVDAAAALRIVTVRGQVRAVSSPYRGLTLITLRDPTGEIDVAVPEATTQLTGPLLDVQAGQSVQVTGAVTLYKATPQIALARADALRLSADSIPVAAPARLADLTSGRAGQWVAVRGSVVKVSPFSAGVRFTLDDGTGHADVVLWSDVYAVLSPTLQLAQGAQVSVQGEVSVYHGAIEIVPEGPTDLALIAAAPAALPTPTVTPKPTPTARPPTPTVAATRAPQPTRAIPLVKMGQLTPADKDKLIAVRGKITAVIPFSRGMKYQLDDGTGKVILLLWEEVLAKVPDRAKLVKGAQVSVTGVVDVYGGDIEVVPGWGTDVQVIP